MSAARVGLDLAKTVLQVHGVDIAGQAVVRRRLARSQLLGFFGKLPPCIIRMERADDTQGTPRRFRSGGNGSRSAGAASCWDSAGRRRGGQPVALAPDRNGRAGGDLAWAPLYSPHAQRRLTAATYAMVSWYGGTPPRARTACSPAL
jgi:hypothetical protein